ncbi:hypothetical protein [uncultured Friedmanniella sp.]|uniref:hypothetical protein n=1 Tax=uncultured Friedmanniella sp. TaxID=335381 RepID=UPI0035CC21EB
MRRLLAVTVAVGLTALAACTSAAPAGPVTSGTALSSPLPSSPLPSSPLPSSPLPSSTATPRKSPSATSKPSDDGSVEEQGDDTSDSKNTSFDDAYTYKDGVRIEITKVRHGTVTAKDVTAGARLKKGTPWVQLTVRVENGSKHRMSELVGDYELSYGPDKEPADPIGLPGQHDRGLSGSIASGKDEVISSTFSIPVKDQDDVVLGFTPDIDHHTAYFSGSIA